MSSIQFFFYLRRNQDICNYHHPLVQLAEGLRALGVRFGSNRRYWPEGPGFLFQPQEDLTEDTADVLVADSEWFGNDEPLPRRFLHPHSHQQTLWFDHSDGVFFEGAFGRSPRDWPKRWWPRHIDHIFRSHLVEGWSYPRGTVPSAFGLTERMIAAQPTFVPHAERERGVLANFRVQHALRKRFLQSQPADLVQRLPLIERFTSGEPTGEQALAWYRITGGRHHPEYYRILRSVTHCSAIGGYFGPAQGRVLSGSFHHTMHLQNQKGILGPRVYQFDSWRLWESLLAGCVTILPRLDRYHCRLPVAPQHSVHYFGFDFDRPDESWEELVALEDRWEAMGQAGREWALEHYSPAPVARRVLEVLGG